MVSYIAGCLQGKKVVTKKDPRFRLMWGQFTAYTTKTFYTFATVDMLHAAIAKSNPKIANDKSQWKTQEILSRLYSFD